MIRILRAVSDTLTFIKKTSYSWGFCTFFFNWWQLWCIWYRYSEQLAGVGAPLTTKHCKYYSPVRPESGRVECDVIPGLRARQSEWWVAHPANRPRRWPVIWKRMPLPDPGDAYWDASSCDPLWCSSHGTAAPSQPHTGQSPTRTKASQCAKACYTNIVHINLYWFIDIVFILLTDLQIEP